MLRRLIFLAVTAALFGACATYHDTNQQLLQTLPQRYNQFDLVLAWDPKVAGGKTVIDGVVKNARYPAMYDLEIWVAVLNAAGIEVDAELRGGHARSAPAGGVPAVAWQVRAPEKSLQQEEAHAHS